ncbi:hypothetical protein [Myxococcus qinghaiensis]|uniref:hypothetical protein n=1 Tax=Myxococcus qinghaiensis TaxID=2906758 RepID=UPI0020A81C9C|nr:hypothetical protein [Myxococcus qinghaiensis]MCP3163069.1 hypothetical protein [Myxococcus qinghaiensis]
MGGVRNGKGADTPEPAAVRQEVPRSGMLEVGPTDDAEVGVARHFGAAVRWLREGAPSRAFEALENACRTLPMSPRLAAGLVRFARSAGAETVVIGLLDSVPATAPAEVRRAVRRQLARVLRRTNQTARAVSVLEAVVAEFPEERRSRRVLEVLRAKGRGDLAPAPTSAVLEKRPTKKSGVQALAVWEEDEVDYHAATVVDATGATSGPPPVLPPPRTLTMELARVQFQVEGPPLGLTVPGGASARSVGPEVGSVHEAPTTVAPSGAGARSVERAESAPRVPADVPFPWDVAPTESVPQPGTSAGGQGIRAGGLPADAVVPGSKVEGGAGKSSEDSGPGAARSDAVDLSTKAAPEVGLLDVEASPTEVDSLARQGVAGTLATEQTSRAGHGDGAVAPTEVASSAVRSDSGALLNDAASGALGGSEGSPDNAASVGTGVAEDSPDKTASSGLSGAEVVQNTAASSGLSGAEVVPGTTASIGSGSTKAQSGTTASIGSGSAKVASSTTASSGLGGAEVAPSTTASVGASGVALSPSQLATGSGGVDDSPSKVASTGSGGVDASPSQAAPTGASDATALSTEVASRVGLSDVDALPTEVASAGGPGDAGALAKGEASNAGRSNAAASPTEAAPGAKLNDTGDVSAGPTPSGVVDRASSRTVRIPTPTSTRASSHESTPNTESQVASSLELTAPTASPISTEPSVSRTDALALPLDAEPGASRADRVASPVQPPTDAVKNDEVAPAPRAEPSDKAIPPKEGAPGSPRATADAPEDDGEFRAKTQVEMPAVRVQDLFPWDAPPQEAPLPARSPSANPTPPSKGKPAASGSPPVLHPVGVEPARSKPQPTPAPTRGEDAPRSETMEVSLADLFAALGGAPVGGSQPLRSEPGVPGTGGPVSARPDPVAPSRTGRSGAAEPTPGEDAEELARSRKLEAQFVARRAWRELAQLYLKRADRAKDPVARAEALTRLAEVMETELQDPAGAARMYREIVELTGDRAALREQVRLLASRDDASLVRRALDEAIQRARTGRARATALLTRGERWLHMGEPEKARADFEASEALAPDLLPALAGLLSCVEDSERSAVAKRLHTVLAATPRRAADRAEALKVLARTAEEQLGDSRLAQWAWGEVLIESPDSEQARERLLWLARELGDTAALAQLLRAQIARESRGPLARQSRLELVATLEASGDDEAALNELRQAVRFEPGHKEAWLLLVERLLARDNKGEAAWALEQAATATEDELEREQTWDRLARMWRESLGNPERAQVYARRAEGLRLAREEQEAALPPEPPRSATPRREPSGPKSLLVPLPVTTTSLVAAGRDDLSEEITSTSDPSALPGGPDEGQGQRGAKSASTSGAQGGGAGARVERSASQGSSAAASAGAEGARERPAGARAEKPSARGEKSTPARGPAAHEDALAALGPELDRPAPSGSTVVFGENAPSPRTDKPAAEAKGPTAPEAPRASAARGERAAAPPARAALPVDGASAQRVERASAPPARAAAPSDSAPATRGDRVSSPPARGAVPADSAPVARGDPVSSPPARAAAPSDSAPAARGERASALPARAAAPSDSAPAARGERAPAQPGRAAAPSDSASAARSERSSAPPTRAPAPAESAPAARGERASAPPARAAPSDSSPAARGERASAPPARAAPSDSAPASRGERASAPPARAAPSDSAPATPPAARGDRAPARAAAPVDSAPPARGERAPARTAPPSDSPPPRAPSRPASPPDAPRGGKAIDLMSGKPMYLDAASVPETRVISWEAPPGRMDPVRRVLRTSRPEGTSAGLAPGRSFISKPPAQPVGAAETRESPIVVPDPAPPADTEPEVFRQLRERPLDPVTYSNLADFFDTRGDAPRAALMREIVEALAGREVPVSRLQRPPLTADERAGLRHPGLRTTSGELLASAGIALCRLFPAQGRAADASEPLRAVAGPGAPAVLDALHTSARVLAVNLPELVLAEDDGPPFTAVHTDKPRLLVGRAAIHQALPAAELRFHAGRALVSLSPDLLALRALKGAQLLRALALLSTVLKNPKDSSSDARLVRETLSPRALERTLELLDSGTRDFNASSLADAARDSANRAGLVACGGVGPAVTVIRSRRSNDSELVELLRFAASERYLALRVPAR